MKAIYEFNWDVGRMGSVEGLFIADIEHVDSVIGSNVYFGEILGKHSEIYGSLDSEDLKIKTQDQGFISKFVEIMGDGTISGYNPLSYIEDDEDE